MPKAEPVWYVHVDRGIIDRNRLRHKLDPQTEMLPAVTIKRGRNGKSKKAFEVDLPAGSKVIYTPETGDPILPCGARLVIVSPSEPAVIR